MLQETAERLVFFCGLGMVMDSLEVRDELAELPEVIKDHLPTPIGDRFLAQLRVLDECEELPLQ